MKIWCQYLKPRTVVPKDYWDRKNFQDMGPLSVNSIHIRGLLFENQNFLTRAYFSTDRLVVLPYKAKCHLGGKISKGSTFLSDRTLYNYSYSISSYPT